MPVAMALEWATGRLSDRSVTIKAVVETIDRPRNRFELTGPHFW